MTLQPLENLVNTRQLKLEQPDQKEFDGLLNSAKRRLEDARIENLSEEGRFSLAYGAAHALALAAMRWQGYRSDNRYLVFQCLQHTVGLDAKKWRVLDLCHKQRNLVEYEGHMEIPSQLMTELVEVTQALLILVENLGPVES